MNSQTNDAGEQLENAFQLFNQFSEKLADSYGDLESQLAQLTEELAEAHDQRLIQLAEKEVLAKRLEGLLDALPAGIVVLDAEGRITQTNPVARQMLGLEFNDNKTKANKLKTYKWQVVAQNTFVTDGDELRLKDGRWVSVSACLLGADPGKIILISDISETHTLQNMLNRQQRLSSLGEMIASLAHQIRTPLSSALLYVSTLNHPMNNETERFRCAEKAKERLHHLERMVSDMLIFARGDVSQSEYINAFEFIAQLKNFLQPDYRVEQVQLVADSNLKNVTIQANCDALLSAMQNIIDNAINACNGTPEIEITAFLNNANQFEINIKDNGCGMSEEVKERALEPFFTTRSNGTGLGLAVVSATVGRYGGEINIHSKPGKGSMFNIKFPRAEVVCMLPSNLSSAENRPNYISTQVTCHSLEIKEKIKVIDTANKKQEVEL